MERVASITSSYYKFSEAAILVFALDNPDSFNVLSQHLLDVVTYAENAKIFLCGNKYDLKTQIQVTDADMENFRWLQQFIISSSVEDRLLLVYQIIIINNFLCVFNLY